MEKRILIVGHEGAVRDIVSSTLTWLVPITNRVVTIVDTNYGVHGLRSSVFYTHFSLLRSIEGGLGLPCLNHACDANTNTMTDMFAEY